MVPLFAQLRGLAPSMAIFQLKVTLVKDIYNLAGQCSAINLGGVAHSNFKVWSLSTWFYLCPFAEISSELIIRLWIAGSRDDGEHPGVCRWKHSVVFGGRCIWGFSENVNPGSRTPVEGTYKEINVLFTCAMVYIFILGNSHQSRIHENEIYIHYIINHKQSYIYICRYCYHI